MLDFLELKGRRFSSTTTIFYQELFFAFFINSSNIALFVTQPVKSCQGRNLL